MGANRKNIGANDDNICSNFEHLIYNCKIHRTFLRKGQMSWEKERQTKKSAGISNRLSCGQRWIRTTEDERQQIYSLPHLATLEFALISK